jgi:hypothetical protein
MRNLAVLNDNEGLSQDGYGAEGTIFVLECEPVLVFWHALWWKIQDIADDGERFGTRRERGSRVSAKDEIVGE